mgnify:CR=1 FL=1
MCSICWQTPCAARCPNYIPKKAKHYCSICEEGILDGEEYIEDDGRFAHWDCIDSKWELAEFLNYEIILSIQPHILFFFQHRHDIPYSFYPPYIKPISLRQYLPSKLITSIS